MSVRPALLAAALVLLIDQASKFWILEILRLDLAGRVEVLPPFLVFSMAWNEGINFGLLSGESDAWRWVLIAIAFGFAAYFVHWSGRQGRTMPARVAAGVLAGGAVGNGIDRVRFGAVVDFLNMSCCGIRNPFSFNVADIAVFAGIVGILLLNRRETEDGKQ